MVKECIKKCSICGHNGHNARSCGANTKKNKEICLKLFGFKVHISQKHEPKHESAKSASATSALATSAMRKCKSTPNMIACDGDHVDAGYVSDGHGVGEKKKGVPWTEDEHISFLSGLQKLGKGDWKGISKNYVHSRTATQVASHAQKYFKRLSLSDKRNRRSSLFDMSLNEPEINNSPPPEPPDGTKEITKLADNLPSLSMSQAGIDEEQADTFRKAAATPLTTPPVFPYFPGYGVPNPSQMPYIPMIGMADNGQIFPIAKSFPAMPSVPVMYIPNPAYFYLPKSPESQAPNTLFMQNFTHGPSPPLAKP